MSPACPADEITPPVSPTARAMSSARPASDRCSRRRETRSKGAAGGGRVHNPAAKVGEDEHG